MSPKILLCLFLAFKLIQEFLEFVLARMNRNYYLNPRNQSHACQVLGIDNESLAKSLSYAEDKYRLSKMESWTSTILTLLFIGLGGIGWTDAVASTFAVSWGGGQIMTGLLLFALLGFLSAVVGLPFDYYRTFVIETRHGFNRQTIRGFWLDLAKGMILGAVLGGVILAVILWIMEKSGPTWWIWAWLALSAISLLTAWLYPTLLAPLFNKFRPLEEGELKQAIDALASRVGFGSKGVLVMDASRRSSHGNAYFTGLFGKKRIVLFDTLISSLTASEIVAVLAHELGHFKLRHVMLGLIRGLATTGALFFALSLCLGFTSFYTAFGLMQPSTYGALLVFGMWFGLIDFYLQPISSHISRRHEFAADRFALAHIANKGELGRALLKLREKSHALPLSHPLYSAVYHSHPPLLERLDAMSQAASLNLEVATTQSK